MNLKKFMLKTAIGTMLLGGFVAAPISLSEMNVEAASVPYVKPQEVSENWVRGDKIDSTGSVYKDASQSIQFTTQKAEKGTLVIEIKKKEYPFLEMYRDKQTDEWFPAFLFVQPYEFDGRDQYAKRAPGKQFSDFINRDSAEHFTIRQVYYIDQPTSTKNYYLGGPGTTDPKSFNYVSTFYPNVNLTALSKEERTNYFKAINNTNIGLNPEKHLGRVLIKGKDTALYNPQGKVHRKLSQYEGLRVYEIQGDRYQVGGGYYVKKTNETLFYVGHVYSEGKYMYVYDPKGGFFKKFVPKQNVRVYSTENGRYQVGAGYYVIPDFHVNFDR